MTTSRPSLIVLGASGGVAQAFLQLLPDNRADIASLYLVDINDSATHNPHIPHSKLEYRFVQADLNDCLPALLSEAVQRDQHVIVLDLTDQTTQPILHSVDAHGVHYVNCSLNADVTTMNDYLPTLEQFGQAYRNGSHILGIGMNPGIINHMILDAIERHGIPQSYVEIEYDSAFPVTDPGSPFITWSKRQFLAEAVIDYSGYCGQEGRYIELEAPPIANPIATEKHLGPIVTLKDYPLGMIVSHDEIISLSQHFGIPGRFVYAIHPTSLQRLRNIYSANGTVRESEVTLLDNTETPLEGSDTIGVWLNYDSHRVCSWCQVLHKDIVGTNATLFMVAVGVLASLVEYLQAYPGTRGVRGVDGLHTRRLLSTVNRYMQIHEIQEDIAHAEKTQ